MKVDKGKLKRCPACGRFFTCQGEDDCWCEKVRIHAKEMKEIMNTYKDCLCPQCLGKYSRE
ncbi:MAG TPA: cysteine-rich CWC family protein [Bacteroidales bacterium]|nr:cysteine-rich CWC family protein [Bacteroidales bacterium]